MKNDMTDDTEAGALLQEVLRSMIERGRASHLIDKITDFLARRDRNADPRKKSIYEIGRELGMFFSADDIKAMGDALQKHGWEFGTKDVPSGEDEDVKTIRRAIDPSGPARNALDRIAARLKECKTC